MTKERSLKLVQSPLSKASDDDRLWFVEHPTREWRIRSPYQDEISHLSTNAIFPHTLSHFASMAAQIEELAEDPFSPPVSDMAICVLQIEKGTRFRVPALRSVRTGSFAIVTADGEPTTPDAMIAGIRASLMVSKPVAIDLGDECSLCGHPDETGDISLMFADVKGQARAVCLPCSYFHIGDGHRPTATSIYVSKADAGTVNLTNVHKDTKRLMDVVATGPFAFTSVLIEIIDKRIDLIRRTMEIKARR